MASVGRRRDANPSHEQRFPSSHARAHTHTQSRGCSLGPGCRSDMYQPRKARRQHVNAPGWDGGGGWSTVAAGMQVTCRRPGWVWTKASMDAGYMRRAIDALASDGAWERWLGGIRCPGPVSIVGIRGSGTMWLACRPEHRWCAWPGFLSVIPRWCRGQRPRVGVGEG